MQKHSTKKWPMDIWRATKSRASTKRSAWRLGCKSQHLTKECDGHPKCPFLQNAPCFLFCSGLEAHLVVKVKIGTRIQVGRTERSKGGKSIPVWHNPQLQRACLKMCHFAWNPFQNVRKCVWTIASAQCKRVRSPNTGIPMAIIHQLCPGIRLGRSLAQKYLSQSSDRTLYLNLNKSEKASQCVVSSFT